MKPVHNQNHRIRVLIADDQTLFVQSLRYVIESRADDIVIVDIATNGREAVELSMKQQPDVVLMDVRMPVMDGVQATAMLRNSLPETKIVMLSTFPDDDYVRSALSYGAIGYLLKNINPEEVIRAIRAVNAGIVQISPSVAKALMNGEQMPNLAADEEMLVEPLTRREREVLHLIVKSYENQQIASFLNVTNQTARNYVHNLYMKLGVSNRLELQRLLQKPEIRRKLGVSE